MGWGSCKEEGRRNRHSEQHQDDKPAKSAKRLGADKAQKTAPPALQPGHFPHEGELFEYDCFGRRCH
jgi:hypothetical protein